ncbi:beta-propeller fold lactonase family protein [Embleya sp. NPDC005971]|uniref:lactonase family protein n=1 Tax=unclassified Embleya TaxID=2699296 RepID=UPI0033E0C8BE
MSRRDDHEPPGSARNHPVPPSRAPILVGGERTVVCEADPDTGALAETGPALAVRTAYAARHPRLDLVYGVDEALDGSITVIEPSRHPRLRQRASSRGAIPCHLAVCPDGGHLVTANYGSGDLIVHRLDEHGSLAGVSEQVALPGPGSRAHPERQSAAHPHQIVFEDQGTLTVVDLGGDVLLTYHLSAGRLRLRSTHRVPTGTGPRHLSGRWLLGELDPAILALPDLTRHPLPAPGLPSAIVTSPDGAHVYAANRGPGTITTLATAAPHTMSDLPAGGADPQDLAFVGDVLYAALPDANAVGAFRRTPGTGLLRPLGMALHLPDPRCLLPIRRLSARAAEPGPDRVGPSAGVRSAE